MRHTGITIDGFRFMNLLKGKSIVAAGPVSRIRRVALQTRKLLNRRWREVSVMSILSVMAGFGSHLCHSRARLPTGQIADLRAVRSDLPKSIGVREANHSEPVFPCAKLQLILSSVR